jgi:predicted AAA+ superfamily ATPase
MEDTEAYSMELRYFRDTDKREVDFVVTKDNKPVYFIESKLSNKGPSSALKYLSSKYPDVKSIQICLKDNINVIDKNNIHLCNAIHFLRELV